MNDNQLIACIGNSWFYISSEYGKTEKDFTDKEIISMIHKAINNEPINSDNADNATECLYYKYYLEERIGKND